MEECSRRLGRSRRNHVHQILFLFLAERKPHTKYHIKNSKNCKKLHHLQSTQSMSTCSVVLLSNILLSQINYELLSSYQSRPWSMVPPQLAEVPIALILYQPNHLSDIGTNSTKITSSTNSVKLCQHLRNSKNV